MITMIQLTNIEGKSNDGWNQYDGCYSCKNNCVRKNAIFCNGWKCKEDFKHIEQQIKLNF
jgi:hypothetical protein